MPRPNPRWLRPLPPGRSLDRVLNHYLVEKEIADRLKRADRVGRTAIYAGMYDELFARVPDHPRLAAVRDPSSLAAHNARKFALIERFINPSTVFVEFAPGDCTFAYLVGRRAERVIGVDISDQSARDVPVPENFSLRIYDGIDLDPAVDRADVVFSDQFIEHLHPDDIDAHIALVRRILKPGGSYILRTPHAFHGPFDISRYFSDVPRGFHLKEWTFAELARRFRRAGFAVVRGGMKRRGRYGEWPVALFAGYERWIGGLPHRVRSIAARALLPRHIYMRAIR